MFVVLGTKVGLQTSVYALFDEPVTSRVATSLGFTIRAPSAFLHASWSDGSSARVTQLVGRAKASESLTCIATSDGEGTDPRGPKLVRAVLDRVLPALDDHFARLADDKSDDSPWLLTRIIAAVIAGQTDEETFDRFATTIEASFGRGDATSTSQNLTAFGNFLYYARETNAAAAERVLAKHPALVAIHRLSDRRTWAGATKAEVLAAANQLATDRHTRGIAQLVKKR